MNAYVYQAALLCEDCGGQEIARINGIWERSSLGAMPTEDSDDYPQGPYPNGGGESDSPQHCDSCGTFLENPLTSDGIAGVEELIWLANHPTPGYLSGSLTEWPLSEYVEFYGLAVTA